MTRPGHQHGEDPVDHGDVGSFESIAYEYDTARPSYPKFRHQSESSLLAASGMPVGNARQTTLPS